MDPTDTKTPLTEPDLLEVIMELDDYDNPDPDGAADRAVALLTRIVTEGYVPTNKRSAYVRPNPR